MGTVLLGKLLAYQQARREAEQALRAQEERYRLLFENSGEGILLTRPDGKIYAANPAACRIFGRSKAEICALGRAGLVDLHDPRLQPALETRRRTGKFNGELNFVRQDGAIFPGELSSTLFRDNILDPLDVQLPVSLDSLTQTDNDLTVRATAKIVPYPSPRRASTTINTLIGVRYRIDGQEWQLATSPVSSFDGVDETYEFAVVNLSPGLHTLEVAAIDSAGNSSDAYAVDTVTILDPLDGGLNTELFLPKGNLQPNQVSLINGVAYHLQNGTIARVEYRINNGLWQLATAQDSRFDSNYEPFTIPIKSLNPGTYLIEAFATDAQGNQEINMASQEIEIKETVYPTYLPLLLR